MSAILPDAVVATKYWHQLDNGRIQCDLCPRFCKLLEGQQGMCFVRARQNDQIVLPTYLSPEGGESSALPSHAPKVCLVSKHLVELLLLIWMLMLVGDGTKISNICFKTVIGPALDELGIRPFGPERAPSY